MPPPPIFNWRACPQLREGAHLPSLKGLFSLPDLELCLLPGVPQFLLLQGGLSTSHLWVVGSAKVPGSARAGSIPPQQPRLCFPPYLTVLSCAFTKSYFRPRPGRRVHWSQGCQVPGSGDCRSQRTQQTSIHTHTVSIANHRLNTQYQGLENLVCSTEEKENKAEGSGKKLLPAWSFSVALEDVAWRCVVWRLLCFHGSVDGCWWRAGGRLD